MLMVVFGAGASYDVRNRGFPPGPGDPNLPLASQLFHPVYGPFAVTYPACQPLMKRLRAAGSNVEQELESIRSEAVHRPGLTRQLEAVRHYLNALIGAAQRRCLESLPDHVTNYIDFLQDIEEWRVKSKERERVCLVTFNYDTLLDWLAGRYSA
jgi:hypothetical protein